MEMGALIAGMTIASFPYHHEVAAKVGNLRDFFVTLFFVALGMSIPVPDSAASCWRWRCCWRWSPCCCASWCSCRCSTSPGLDRNNALDASTKLAQISEFCLVIAYLGVKAGHIDDAHRQRRDLRVRAHRAGHAARCSTLSRTLPAQLGPLLGRARLHEAPATDARVSMHGHARAPRS